MASPLPEKYDVAVQWLSPPDSSKFPHFRFFNDFLIPQLPLILLLYS